MIENIQLTKHKCVFLRKLIVVSSALAILMVGLSGQAESASVKDRRTAAEKHCDALAASPSDPGIRGEKVDFQKQNVAAALPACEEAASDSAEPRYWYQLGRVLHKAGAYTKALPWYLKAASHGNALAQNNLGLMYQDGLGVSRNLITAHNYYRKAAVQGLAYAQFQLGVMYFNGVGGVPKSDAKAAALYLQAAVQGLAMAQNNLGVMYHYGQGVPQSDAKAAVLYRKAIAQGNALAQDNLRKLEGGGQSWRGGTKEEALQQLMIRQQNRAAAGKPW